MKQKKGMVAMRVVISAGGTGGHIFPALAIMEKIKEKDPRAEILYIGTTDRMESTLIPDKKIPYKGIPMKGLDRKHLLSNVKVLHTFFKAIQIAKQELLSFQPDVVIGVGGYITAPVIYAAHKLHIPTVIHEQNSIAGLSNRFLSRYVDKVFISFEESREAFPKEKTIFTGNPRSEAVIKEKKGNKKIYDLTVSKKLVVIVMGSLGSQTVTEKLKEMVPHFKEVSYEVLLVTGKNYYEEFQKVSIPKNVKVVPFITDFLGILKCADLIVTRAGASSIAEITALGLPAIFVPSPYVTHNHQMRNAEALEKQGAGFILEEKDLSYETLLPMIEKAFDKNTYHSMQQASKKMGVLDSASRIYQEVVSLVKENVK